MANAYGHLPYMLRVMHVARGYVCLARGKGRRGASAFPAPTTHYRPEHTRGLALTPHKGWMTTTCNKNVMTETQSTLIGLTIYTCTHTQYDPD